MYRRADGTTSPMHAAYEAKKLAGICTKNAHTASGGCTEPPKEGTTKCERHLVEAHEYLRRRRGASTPEREPIVRRRRGLLSQEERDRLLREAEELESPKARMVRVNDRWAEALVGKDLRSTYPEATLADARRPGMGCDWVLTFPNGETWYVEVKYVGGGPAHLTKNEHDLALEAEVYVVALVDEAGAIDYRFDPEFDEVPQPPKYRLREAS